MFKDTHKASVALAERTKGEVVRYGDRKMRAGGCRKEQHFYLNEAESH